MKSFLILIGTLLAALYLVEGKILIPTRTRSRTRPRREISSRDDTNNGVVIKVEHRLNPFPDPNATSDTLNRNKSESESEPEPGAESDITKDRFGFNVNKAHAHAYGPWGSYGGSDASSYGVHAGIVGPGNSYYRPLYQNTGGHAHTYNSGQGAPATWANAQSNAAPGQVGGQGSSGYRGGYGGNAFADSYSVLHRVPLGDGTTLLSNFKNSNTTADEAAKVNSENSPGQVQLPVPVPVPVPSPAAEQSNSQDAASVSFPNER